MVKNPPTNAGDARCMFDPWVRKIPWRTEWHPTPVFLPIKSHGQRSLVGYSPWWDCKESDTTEHTHFFPHCVLFSEYFGNSWILHIHLCFINSHKKLVAVSINIVLNLFSYCGGELTFLLYKVVHYTFNFWYCLSTSFQYIILNLDFKQFHKFKQMIDLCLDNMGRILHISEGCK